MKVDGGFDEIQIADHPWACPVDHLFIFQLKPKYSRKR